MTVEIYFMINLHESMGPGRDRILCWDSFFFEGALIHLYTGTPTFWQRGLWDSCLEILVRALS